MSTLASTRPARLTPSPLLRFAIRLDGVCSLLAGLATLAGAGLVARWLGLAESATLGLGLFMAGYGGLLLWLGVQRRVWAVLPQLLSYGNGAWAVLSVMVTALGWLGVGPAGQALMLGQAALVGLFAVLQGLGGRSSPPAQ
ncbi:MAG: hypothetical protein MUE46_10710 [Xanthomonadales bacterium]|jgi:hypothetical protein|nr:hypothetical protein [Xanthomonadales bacterium]